MTEESLQIAVADYLRLAAPSLLWFHVANERKCTPQRGAKLKRLGVLAGVPDLVFVLANGQVRFIELKAGRGRLTDKQAEFFEAALILATPCATARSVEEVAAILRGWGVQLRATVAA